MSEQDKTVEAWFQRRTLTLDLAGLSEEQRSEGSILLGGSAAEFVLPHESFEYHQISSVVFRWGDEKAEQVFSILLEHDDTPAEYLFPFSASTVIGGMVWLLAVQERGFEPHIAYRDDAQYTVLPFNEAEGALALQNYLASPPPRRELLGKVGPRWVAFGVGTDI